MQRAVARTPWRGAVLRDCPHPDPLTQEKDWGSSFGGEGALPRRVGVAWQVA